MAGGKCAAQALLRCFGQNHFEALATQSNETSYLQKLPRGNKRLPHGSQKQSRRSQRDPHALDKTRSIFADPHNSPDNLIEV